MQKVVLDCTGIFINWWLMENWKNLLMSIIKGPINWSMAHTHTTKCAVIYKIRKYLQLEKQILLIHFLSKKIKPNQTISVMYLLFWVDLTPMGAPPLASQDILGCCGPGEQPVSGIFRRSGISELCFQRSRERGNAGNAWLWWPVEDEVLKEASVVRNWVLHLVHPRQEQVRVSCVLALWFCIRDSFRGPHNICLHSSSFSFHFNYLQRNCFKCISYR